MKGIKKYSDHEVDEARERSERGLVMAKDLAIRKMTQWIRQFDDMTVLSKTQQDSLSKFSNAIAKLMPQPNSNIFNITNINRDDLISEVKRLTAIANSRAAKKPNEPDHN